MRDAPPDPAPPPLDGPLAARYRLDAALRAEGAPARHRSSGRRVHVRVFPHSSAADRRVRLAALREALSLDHPALVRVLEVGVSTRADAELGLSPGTPWAVVEAIDAQPLPDRPQPWPVARRALLAALDALAHLQARGVAAPDPLQLRLGADGAVRLDGVGQGPLAVAGGPAGAPSGPWSASLWAGLSEAEPTDPDLTDEDDGPTDLFARPIAPGPEPQLVELARRARRWAGPDAPAAFAPWLARLVDPPPVGFGHAGRAASALRQLDPLAFEVSGLEDEPTAIGSGAVVAPPAEGWPGGLRPAGAGPVPLVGRHAEQAALWSALDRVRAEGQPRVVVVDGPPGVGRARLVAHVAGRAAQAGRARWLHARHGPAGGPTCGLGACLVQLTGLPAAGPVLPHLRAWCRLHGLPPAVAEVLGAWLAPQAGDALVGPLDRHQALHAVVEALIRRDGAVVLSLEDAQWGLDSLAAVHHLLDAQPALPLLVLATVRADRLSRRPQAGALLDRLLAWPGAGRLRLPPLGPGEQDQLLVQHLGLSPSAAAAVAGAARGSPLMAVELVRELAAGGHLVEDISGRRIVGEAALPEGPEALWLARLQRVLGEEGPECDALETLGVLGGELPAAEWAGLARACGLPAPDELVERWTAAGLLAPERGGRLRLGHGSLVPALIRRARRRGVLPRHHQRAAALVAAARSPGEPPALRELRHRVGAGEGAGLVPAARAALARAVHGGCSGEAIDLLRILDDEPPPEAALTVAVAGAQVALLRWDGVDARSRALRALPLARRAGDAEAEGLLRLVDGALSLQEGDAEGAGEHGHAAEVLAHRAGRPELRAEALCLQAEAALAVGDLGEAESCLDAGAGPPGRRARAEARLALLRADRVAALGHARRAAALSRAAGRWLEHAEALCLEGEIARQMGDLGLAVRRLDAAAGWHRALGTAPGWPPALSRALIRLSLGDAREAHRLLDGLIDELHQRGPPAAALLARLGLALVALARGGSEPALHLRRARDLCAEADLVEPAALPLCEALFDEARAADRGPVAGLAARVAAATLRAWGRADEAQRWDDRVDGG
jgi:hypothetical protein